jgi:hypothetical protein
VRELSDAAAGRRRAEAEAFEARRAAAQREEAKLADAELSPERPRAPVDIWSVDIDDFV